MAIHTILATGSSNGTTNMSTQAMERVSADSKIQGRALPTSVWVRSMSCPTTKLAMTMRMVERS